MPTHYSGNDLFTPFSGEDVYVYVEGDIERLAFDQLTDFKNGRLFFIALRDISGPTLTNMSVDDSGLTMIAGRDIIVSTDTSASSFNKITMLANRDIVINAKMEWKSNNWLFFGGGDGGGQTAKGRQHIVAGNDVKITANGVTHELYSESDSYCDPTCTVSEFAETTGATPGRRI